MEKASGEKQDKQPINWLAVAPLSMLSVLCVVSLATTFAALMQPKEVVDAKGASLIQSSAPVDREDKEIDLHLIRFRKIPKQIRRSQPQKPQVSPRSSEVPDSLLSEFKSRNSRNKKMREMGYKLTNSGWVLENETN